MPYFTKRPVTIEAVQLNWKNWDAVCNFLVNPDGTHIISEENPGRDAYDANDNCDELGPFIELTIPTLEGHMTARHGDWIIKGVRGEFYPCHPDIFRETYEHAPVVT